MGICASSQTTSRGGNNSWPSTAKLIHIDGKLQEFRTPIRAGNVLSSNPNCFLCSLDTMYLDSYMPHVPDTEELQLGQIYFLMPLSHSHIPLSISHLCALAIKASTALSKHDVQLSPGEVSPSHSHGRQDVRLKASSRGGCNIPGGLNVVRLGSQVGRCNRGIEY